jgi:hypothetical protein
MRTFTVTADPRLVARRVKTAIQGDVIKALAELVTNCDDSYRILEGDNIPANGSIDIIYHKQGRFACRFAVRDNAAGMSYDELSRNFEFYGSSTSGFKSGKSVTGFFGTGAKNALAAMIDGRMCTFKDGIFTECRIFFKDDILSGEIDDARPATAALRLEHGIEGNGTIAYFMADPDKGLKVPQFDTVFSSLANSWRLRKIMSNRKRRITLINAGDKNRRRHLSYGILKGIEIVNLPIATAVDGYGELSAHMTLYRAGDELLQSGDERHGGLLIVDDAQSVLDISLFKYDNEPLASHLFGELVIYGFRELMEREEPILKEERDGINRCHPVCAAIIDEVEQRIGRAVREEEQRRRQSQVRPDSAETKRYMAGINVLNAIAEAEIEDIIDLGQKINRKEQTRPESIDLLPSSAHVSLGKQCVLYVFINTKVIAPGTRVAITCTNKLQIIGKEFFIVPKPRNDAKIKNLAICHVTVKASEIGESVLTIECGDYSSSSTIYIDPEKEEKDLLYSEGLIFRPQHLSVRLNRVRESSLLVYTPVVTDGIKVRIRVEGDNSENVFVSPEEIEVVASDAEKDVIEYKVEVWGDSIGAKALVVAETEFEQVALLEVCVRESVEDEKNRGKGMFNKPCFDLSEQDPSQRTSYSKETGQVIIYGNFPSVRHYLGKDCRFKKTLAGQVLIADMVAERCFFEIARAKVDRGVALGSGEQRIEKIRGIAEMLSKKYGHTIHSQMVDNDLVDADRSQTDHEESN